MITSRSRWIAYAQVALSVTFVGASVPLAKLMLTHIPIMLACGVRFVAATALALPLLWWRGRSLRRIAASDHYLLVTQAIPGVFLFPVLLFEGLRTASGSAAGIVTGCLPAAIAVVAALVLRERPSRRVLIGIALAVVGMVVLNLQTVPTGNVAQNWGLSLVFAAVMAEAVYSVLARRLGTRVPPVASAAWLSLFGLCAFAPFAIYEATSIDLDAVPLSAWLIAAYLGVFPSLVAFLLYYSAIQRIEASTAGVFTGLLPLTAMALSIAFLGERLGPHEIIGAALILGAIALTVAPISWNRRR